MQSPGLSLILNRESTASRTKNTVASILQSFPSLRRNLYSSLPNRQSLSGWENMRALRPSSSSILFFSMSAHVDFPHPSIPSTTNQDISDPHQDHDDRYRERNGQIVVGAGTDGFHGGCDASCREASDRSRERA